MNAADLKVVAAAVLLLTRYPAEAVCNIIWNRYGYMTGIRAGQLIIGSVHIYRIDLEPTP